MNKENIAATPTFTRKRAKSFSTPPTAKPTTRLSRGILKGTNNGDDAHTIAFIPIHSPSKRTSGSAEKRRKSLNRRVSFASHASVRLFEKAGASPPQSTPRRSMRTSPAKSPINAFQQDSPSKSPASREIAGDVSNDEITMDLTNVIPRLLPQIKQTNPLSAPTPMSDEESSDGDSDEFEDADVGEDDTAAMDLTDILPAPSNQATMSTFQSRIPRKSVSPSKARPDSFAAEDNGTMDMTRAIGTILPAMDATSPFVDADEGMEMTRLVGGILQAARSLPDSPTRRALHPSLSLAKLRAVEDNEDDMTMNMDETRVYNVGSATVDEPTSHTSYTVATEEDDTQRLCEGSVTQADGFTQNMDFTRALPNQIEVAKVKSPTRAVGLGFSWGANTHSSEQSLMDMSMTDVTQNDESINMDMTQAVFGHVLQDESRFLGPVDESQTMNMEMTQVIAPMSNSDSYADMDMTRVVTTGPIRQTVLTPSKSDTKARTLTPSPSKSGPLSTLVSPVRRTPRATARSAERQKPGTSSPSKASIAVRRLSTGAVRSPKSVPDASMSPQVSTPVLRNAPSTPRPWSTSRRKSLLDTKMPEFGTPESKVLLEPGSAQKPEFGSTLIATEDLRVSALKEKIQSLTPGKNVTSAVPMSNRLRSLENQSSQLETPSKRARFTTPQKTPQRSLLMPTASITRPSTTPAKDAKETNDAPLSPIVLNDFLKMTGISFLTGLSTTRRRETMVVPSIAQEASGDEGVEAARLQTEAFTVPMLEMYQHSCRELTRYITEGRAMCDEIESDMNDQNPELFDQYRRANAAGKRELETKFKAMKTMARLSAKGVWYVWRENLLSGVLVPLKKNLAGLEKEQARLQAYEETATPLFARVKKEYDELKATVESLLQEEDRYESFDHEEAARLTQANAEAKAKLEDAQQELKLAQSTEHDLQEQLKSLEEEFERKSAEVAQLEQEAEKSRGYSAAELAELKRDYDTLTQRTGMVLQHVSGEAVVLSYKDSLSISIALTSDHRLSLALEKLEDQCDIVKSYYLTQIKANLAELSSSTPSHKESLAFVRDQWSAALILRSEIETLETAYPIILKVNEDDNLEVTASVLLPASRTKFLVKFTSTPLQALNECSLDVEVDVKYGGLDGAKVKSHVMSRLHAKSTANRANGWLLDSLKMPEGL